MSVRALLEKVGSQLSFSWYHPPKQGDWRGSFSFISCCKITTFPTPSQ